MSKAYCENCKTSVIVSVVEEPEEFKSIDGRKVEILAQHFVCDECGENINDIDQHIKNVEKAMEMLKQGEGYI
jgi:Fe2+ or Zn2+ uptake regulation protein